MLSSLNPKLKLLFLATIVIVAFSVIFINSNVENGSELFVKAKSGTFNSLVEITGELEAKNSVNVLCSPLLQEFNIWNVTILSIISEGSVVKKGDWIASLDNSELLNKLSEAKSELNKTQSELKLIQLDTALQLKQLRDELTNIEFEVMEKKTAVNLSKYDPAAVIEQARINLEKSNRLYSQAIDKYKIRKKQAVERVNGSYQELLKARERVAYMENTLDAFTIVAPQGGMVIYTKGADGQPIRGGSQINTWNPIVATLPDLDTMISRAFINEVDIRKVKRGQYVEIGLEAYPNKKLTGEVSFISNIGTSIHSFGGNLFEIKIEIKNKDHDIKPHMTTYNRIFVSQVKKAVYIPIEAIHEEFDTIFYAYVKDKNSYTKKEIKLGVDNGQDVVVTHGISSHDYVLISDPIIIK